MKTILSGPQLRDEPFYSLRSCGESGNSLGPTLSFTHIYG